VTFLNTVSRLDAALRRELPGAQAHALLAPRPRREWPPGFNPARIRDAAGLLLVYPKPPQDAAHVVLTVRAGTLGRHGGQVSLPGGVIDPGESVPQAALREAHEEVGLALEAVRVMGMLTPLDIPVSGFRLHPVVASVDRAPIFTAADGEVARVLEMPIADLLEASSIAETERTRDGRLLTIPAFHLAGVEIWGATAMVLAEFLSLLGWTRL
jgi:8-oxo-dGTP pyrophosphatase MutT (NUDIX family)